MTEWRDVVRGLLKGVAYATCLVVPLTLLALAMTWGGVW